VSLAPYVHLTTSLRDAVAGTQVPLDPDAAHHLSRVLRLRPGAAVVVADGAGHEAPAHLGDGVVVLEHGARAASAGDLRLTVAQALPKARKLDEVVRQVTELGVDRVVPVAAERSVVRLDGDRAERAVTRWRAVARAAAEQARRPRLPAVAPVTSTSDLAPALLPGDRLLVAHVGADRSLAAAVAAAVADGASGVVIAVGPEGGWSDTEVAALEAEGGELVGLGPSVLRTEHAAAAAVAVAAALGGRWG
jgi:16S rRNA (uracil1498-N3)-methyltransferase